MSSSEKKQSATNGGKAMNVRKAFHKMKDSMHCGGASSDIDKAGRDPNLEDVDEIKSGTEDEDIREKVTPNNSPASGDDIEEEYQEYEPPIDPLDVQLKNLIELCKAKTLKTDQFLSTYDETFEEGHDKSTTLLTNASSYCALSTEIENMLRENEVVEAQIKALEEGVSKAFQVSNDTMIATKKRKSKTDI